MLAGSLFLFSLVSQQLEALGSLPRQAPEWVAAIPGQGSGRLGMPLGDYLGLFPPGVPASFVLQGSSLKTCFRFSGVEMNPESICGLSGNSAARISDENQASSPPRAPTANFRLLALQALVCSAWGGRSPGRSSGRNFRVSQNGEPLLWMVSKGKSEGRQPREAANFKTQLGQWSSSDCLLWGGVPGRNKQLSGD